MTSIANGLMESVLERRMENQLDLTMKKQKFHK